MSWAAAIPGPPGGRRLIQPRQGGSRRRPNNQNWKSAMTRSDGRIDRTRHWGSALARALLPVWAVATLCWLGTPTRALAEVLDEPESLTEGSDALVRVHFDVRVQYQ